MRGLLFIVILGLLVLLAYSMGWIQFSSSNSPDKSDIGITINKDEVHKDVDRADRGLNRAGEKAREELENLGRKLKGSSNSETPSLKVSRYAVAVEAGSRIDVTVTRLGTDLKPAELTFVTSPGSNLVVTGGKFSAGQRDTTVTIEAPPGSVDGRVDLKSGELKESITVEVKNQPASMWDQSPGWPPRRQTYKF